MNKMEARKKARDVMIKEVIGKIELLEERSKSIRDPVEFVQLVQQLAYFKALRGLNWRTLKIDGKVDKRRYRRYVAKHASSAQKTQINTGKINPDIGEILSETVSPNMQVTII